MSLTLHEASVPVFARMLDQLAGVLRKAAAHAEATGTDPASLLDSRLHPDMYPLAKQVQVAADAAADAAASLAGVAPPPFANDEKTFAELLERVRATGAFLGTLAPERFAGAEDRTVTWTARGTPVSVKGAAYLLNHAMPKFYFHVAMAYAILRHEGVGLRKGDFMGKA